MLKRSLPILAGILIFLGIHLYREFGGSTPKWVSKGTGKETAKDAGVELNAADRALSAKLQPFITCINRTDSGLLRNYALYRAHVQTLLTPPKPGVFFVGDTFRNFKVEVYEQENNISKPCAEGLEKAVSMSPADADLDRIAPAYAATVRSLIPLMNEADVYYGQKDHADDKMAKGRKLDAQIAPLFETLQKLSGDMRTAVAVRENKLQENRLEALEKQRGKTLDWHTLNAMIEARRAVGSLDATGKVPTKEIALAAEQRLQVAFDGGRAASDAAPPVAANARKHLWTSIQSDIANTLAALKELRRDLDAGKPAADVTRGVERVFRDYNSLVRNHNMMSRF